MMGHILSEVDIKFLPEINKYINLQCNGDMSLYTEFPELKHIDDYLKDMQPQNVLDIGSGIGRASVYFFRKYGWDKTVFNLLDGNTGNRQVDGVRSKDGEFYNSFFIANMFCNSNDLYNVKMWNAPQNMWRYNLKDIDFAYSFLAIGFHWPLDFYLKKIYSVLSKNALIIFGMRGTEKKEWVNKQILNIDANKYDTLKFIHMPTETRESVLVLRRK